MDTAKWNHLIIQHSSCLFFFGSRECSSAWERSGRPKEALHFCENNAAASSPAVFDWRLDEKLDVLQIPKPGDDLGTRIVKEACSMSICKTHYMGHFKVMHTTGTMYRENMFISHKGNKSWLRKKGNLTEKLWTIFFYTLNWQRLSCYQVEWRLLKVSGLTEN